MEEIRLIELSGVVGEERSAAGCGSRENSNGLKLAHVPFLFGCLLLWGLFLGFLVGWFVLFAFLGFE